MKTYLTLLTSLFLVFQSHARLMRIWTFDTLNDKATLIVIAIPTKVVETSEAVALPNIETVYPDGRHVAVMSKGVETSFKVLTVLKGDRDIKQLVLHHYSLASAPGDGDPLLVSFKPGGNKQFLMFLQKETDGRYVAVSGQTDPAFSIIGIEQNFVMMPSNTALTTAAASAKDYHLVATRLRGAPASGKPAEFPMVYVLLAPDITGQLNPMVYKTFDSKDMELDIGVLIRSGIIAPGSVLHFDPKPDLERPTDAQIQSLTDYCKKLGITLAVS